MKFLIISHVFHKQQNGHWFAYAPYVREMNIWLQYVDEVNIVAPVASKAVSDIDCSYQHARLLVSQIPSIEFTSFSKAIASICKLPGIFFKIVKACKTADHIHLRCPGNIGLIGSFVQVFFPKKIKTAKYAGNWDPKAKQPLSYRFQKWVLSNTFLTKNMQVLVYGNWIEQSKNIKPFFTASYYESEKEPWFENDFYDDLRMLFVGSLVKGKRPLLAIKIVEALRKQGIKASLDIYGDGVLREKLKNYIILNKLGNSVKLLGNQSKETVKEAMRNAHFLILPSRSEGWPKAVAEAMFFGVIPISTRVSCVPYMLDYGKRGILIEPNIEDAVSVIIQVLQENDLKTMSKLAWQWSQQFTLDRFEEEIKNILIN